MKVVDLNRFRAKKLLREKIAGGREPLYATHLEEMDQDRPGVEDDLADIRIGLQKIDELMKELDMLESMRQVPR